MNPSKIITKISEMSYSSISEIFNDVPLSERKDNKLLECIENILQEVGEETFNLSLKNKDFSTSVKTCLRLISYISKKYQLRSDLFEYGSSIDFIDGNPKLTIQISFDDVGSLSIQTVNGKNIVEYAYAEMTESRNLISLSGKIKITKNVENTEKALNLLHPILWSIK